MEQSIKQWCIANDYDYTFIPSESMQIIYDLLLLDKFNEPTTNTEYVYFGAYYNLTKDYDQMFEYYLTAIDKGDMYAMNNLAMYYEDIGNYDYMLKYYLMAIDKGNSNAMNNLACYYEDVKKDYENMLKYYLMAIDKGSNVASYNLAGYYGDIKDYENMLKYYLIAVDQGDTDAMYNLASYYRNQPNYENMTKYYLMAIEKGDRDAMLTLAEYFKNTNNYSDLIKLYYKYKNNDLIPQLNEYLVNNCNNSLSDDILEIILNLEIKDIDEMNLPLKVIYKLLKSKIDQLELHFKYAPDAEGYKEAKKDFLYQLSI